MTSVNFVWVELPSLSAHEGELNATTTKLILNEGSPSQRSPPASAHFRRRGSNNVYAIHAKPGFKDFAHP
ncbi:RNA polymerase beta subunit [Sesbania bispinosa]|nr:RNA polymerase beta subunit [Sesbania bispinosa]